MSDATRKRPRLFNRTVEFIVLILAFFISSQLLSIELQYALLVQALTYAVILLVFVTVCKAIAAIYQNPISAIIRQILGNGAGIALGSVVMVLLEKVFTTGGELLVLVILSSIMAFFILGTLTPLFHGKTPHTDNFS